MEAADRAARDSDEAEREDLAGEDGPVAVRELRQRRHFQLRRRKEDADQIDVAFLDCDSGAPLDQIQAGAPSLAYGVLAADPGGPGP